MNCSLGREVEYEVDEWYGFKNRVELEVLGKLDEEDALTTALVSLLVDSVPDRMGSYRDSWDARRESEDMVLPPWDSVGTVAKYCYIASDIVSRVQAICSRIDDVLDDQGVAPTPADAIAWSTE